MESGKKKRIYKIIGIFTGIFFITTLLVFGIYFSFEKKYEGKIYPGVRIGAFDFSGLNRIQAKEKIDNEISRVSREGITFNYNGHNSSLFPLISSLDSDIAIEVLAFDPDTAVDRLYRYGREGIFIRRLVQKINLLIRPAYYSFFFAINESELEKFFTENFRSFSLPAQDARLSYRSDNASTTIEFFIEEEKLGQTIDFSKAAIELKRKLANLDFSPITLSSAIDNPNIYEKDLLNIESTADEIISYSPLTLKYQEKSWKIGKADLANWLVIKKGIGSTTVENFLVGLDESRTSDYLKENIAKEIDIEPGEAKFEMKDGKVVEFQTSRNGRELALKENARLIEKELVINKKNSIDLIVSEKKSAITTENINDLGIKELLGTGHSNFAGSPANRRHNIAVGASSVNGTIVKPGEEFSLLKVLGKIDATTGYKPELVIKDNKTTPEYGGGLCQIGTTAFRGTLSAGLPVTMRRNHSYRVSYYEPAGTDATIYDPWPDYRFKNDYTSHLLITSRIEGNDLYFDFWGTKDGRAATATYPVIYNIVKPAPTLLVESPDLKPGEKKCTEHAHNGADAYFDYTVKYSAENLPEDKKSDEKFIADDYTASTRFKSHYVPWREVCLVGIDPKKSASSTADKIE